MSRIFQKNNEILYLVRRGVDMWAIPHDISQCSAKLHMNWKERLHNYYFMGCLMIQ